MKHQSNIIGPRTAEQRFILTAVTVAVLTLAHSAAAADAPMQRVEVTGSSIKRLAAENALPLTTIKAEELTNRGLTTMSEVATALTVASTNEPVGGGGGGTMINMRGLNTNRTLVLLNGRRLANEALGDSSVNVDVIPMAAIERVEVLRDGASALYGTDAIAGVVNFITKKSIKDVSVSASVVEPEHQGGGQQRRFGFVAGKGDLAEDGWNIYTAFDTQKRTRLLQKDRPGITDPATIVKLGGTAFVPNSSSVGAASPANYTVYANGKPTSTTGNPYFAAGCASPFATQTTIPSTRASGAGSRTCVTDPTLYPELLPEAAQTTLFTKGSLAHGDGKVFSVELQLARSYIDAGDAPQPFGANVDYDLLNGSSGRRPLMITKASKWYPGGSGGVPAVAGVTGQDLALNWSLDELGGVVSHDVQTNHRLVAADEGDFKGWDYRVGASYAYSHRDVGLKSGFVKTPGLYAGVANGTLNPFGPQDEAGRAYLESISADGQTYREADVRYYGADFNLSRTFMELKGGSLGLAIGGDWHRETFEEDMNMLGNEVVYKISGSPGRNPSGSRKVAGLYAELDAPVTKQLNLNFAVRGDHFSDFGSTFNPKASFRYQPLKEVMIRGTVSTGFRAPTLPELYGTPRTLTASSFSWDDPLLCPSATPGAAGTGQVTTDPRYAGLNLDPSRVCNTRLTTLTGANPDLQPEKSKTYTIGFVVEPFKNFMATVDFWKIDMTRTIAQIDEPTIFNNLGQYQDLFVRNPDGTLQYITKTRLNMGGLRTQGIDIGMSYLLPTANWGRFGASLDGTFTDKYEGQNEVGSEWIDVVGRVGALATGSTSSNTYVFKWKHTARVNWTYGPLFTQLTQQYSSSYEDTNALPTQKPGQPFYNVIEPYSVYNLTASYKVSDKFKIGGGVNNLFDTDPPLSNQRLSSRVVFARNIAKPIGRTFTVRADYTF
ncbi:TonB-dependent receptor [Massilia sp. Dwa41.01b]|uniref:TonB-dependent receptor n=1 Tax=unclassified Massilia TaxID=2609279 RepID=UPI0015FF3FF5|nr:MULTISPECIES: TonB-dependent receptor [unclassified Massilia]QNA89186.1 TonB-dependent receptor [Massilia sp. Dwa41.01b]QNB00087.1 TonB-dependent receptor [Massilia sp. Se16.2.3]